MTPTDMIYLLRQHLNDEQFVGWPNDSELIAYLDRAANYLSEQLIADRDPAMSAEFLVPADGGVLPEDFVAFVGNTPVGVTGRAAKPLRHEDCTARYWARLKRFSSLAPDNQSPYTPAQESLVVDIARLFALNKNEYDISQDMTLLADMRNVMRAARGGVGTT
jgi:hypothetical protein